jgi:hypothetical protein
VDLKGGTGLLNVDRALRAAQTQFTASGTANLSDSHGFALGSVIRDEIPSVTYTVVVPASPVGLLPHLRIAAAFDAAPDSAAGGGSDILDADIDLVVRRETDGDPLQCLYSDEHYYSASYDNSYEFVECHISNPDPNATYTVQVNGSSFNRSVAWYGLAIAKDDFWLGTPP